MPDPGRSGRAEAGEALGRAGGARRWLPLASQPSEAECSKGVLMALAILERSLGPGVAQGLDAGPGDEGVQFGSQSLSQSQSPGCCSSPGGPSSAGRQRRDPGTGGAGCTGVSAPRAAAGEPAGDGYAGDTHPRARGGGSRGRRCGRGASVGVVSCSGSGRGKGGRAGGRSRGVGGAGSRGHSCESASCHCSQERGQMGWGCGRQAGRQ